MTRIFIRYNYTITNMMYYHLVIKWYNIYIKFNFLYRFLDFLRYFPQYILNFENPLYNILKFNDVKIRKINWRVYKYLINIMYTWYGFHIHPGGMVAGSINQQLGLRPMLGIMPG